MTDYERGVVLTDDEAAIIIHSLAQTLARSPLSDVRAVTDVLHKVASAARSVRIAENAFEDLPLVQGALPKKTTYVRSESDEKKAYKVEAIGKLYWCDCPSFRYFKGLDKSGQCKHIRKVREDELYHGHSR